MDLGSIKTAPCAADQCELLTASSRLWRTLTLEQRQPLIAAGVRRRGARGMCVACTRRGGVPPSSGRAPMVSAEVAVNEWRWLHEAGTLSSCEPAAVRIRTAAPRIGMTPVALEKALARAGVAA